MEEPSRTDAARGPTMEDIPLPQRKSPTNAQPSALEWHQLSKGVTVPNQEASLIGSFQWATDKGWAPQAAQTAQLQKTTQAEQAGASGTGTSAQSGSQQCQGPKQPINSDVWSQMGFTFPQNMDGLPMPQPGETADQPLLHAIMPQAGALSVSQELPKFTKESTEKMYRSNHELLVIIGEAINELQRDSPSPMTLTTLLDGAKCKASTTAKTLIQRRLKLIRIADKYGWQAATIYEGTGEIGETPEDNKKIKAAAAEVERMRKKSDSLKSGRRSFQTAFGGTPASGQQWQTVGAPQWQPFWPRGLWYPDGRMAPYFQIPRNAVNGCFVCGSTAHWANNCPQNRGKGITAKKSED